MLLTAPATAAAAPTISVPSQLSVPEKVGEVRIGVTLSEPSAAPFEVSWKTEPTPRWLADAPASLPGVDYVEASGALTFAPGETQREVSVTVLDDAVDDPSPFFAVVFGPGEDPSTPVSLVNIVDDDPTPASSVADVRVAEGASVAVVPVTRPAISRLGNAVYGWRTVAGSATAPGDFTAQQGTVTIPWGGDRAEVRVPIVDDALAEPDEDLRLVLEPASPVPSPWTGFSGPIDDGVATVTIADDDRTEQPRTVAWATRVRGRVTLQGRRLLQPRELALGARLNARRGAARIDVSRDGRVLRSATIAAGAVRLTSARTLALASRALQVVSARGMRIAGRSATARAATPDARWRMADTARGTRVRVLRGAVRVGGALVRAGRSRLFR